MPPWRDALLDGIDSGLLADFARLRRLFGGDLVTGAAFLWAQQMIGKYTVVCEWGGLRAKDLDRGATAIVYQIANWGAHLAASDEAMRQWERKPFWKKAFSQPSTPSFGVDDDWFSDPSGDPDAAIQERFGDGRVWRNPQAIITGAVFLQMIAQFARKGFPKGEECSVDYASPAQYATLYDLVYKRLSDSIRKAIDRSRPGS